jgi:hypothetical protein
LDFTLHGACPLFYNSILGKAPRLSRVAGGKLLTLIRTAQHCIKRGQSGWIFRPFFTFFIDGNIYDKKEIRLDLIGRFNPQRKE